MTRTAEVVVVGPGVVGSSIAYNLARLGVRDVVVVDRDGVAAHASRLSAGLVRTHYGNAPEARYAHAARALAEWSARGVLIEPDENRLVLVWRAVMQCDKKALRVNEVRTAALMAA